MSTILDEIANGQGIPFATLARTQSATRGGGKLSPATVWRWCRKGVRLDDGTTVVHLEHARLGGRWVTTHAAFRRFIAAQNPESGPTPTTEEAQPKPRESHARATEELESLGI